jgi:hypothetical protein
MEGTMSYQTELLMEQRTAELRRARPSYRSATTDAGPRRRSGRVALGHGLVRLGDRLLAQPAGAPAIR